MHKPVHSALGSPEVAPKRPTTHDKHAGEPTGAYRPGAHNSAVLFTDPAAQAWPESHKPLQFDVVMAVLAP